MFEFIKENAIVRNPMIEVQDAEIEKRFMKLCKDIGIVHRFRDIETGEIHEVQPDDHETFGKMVDDKNMQLVFD